MSSKPEQKLLADLVDPELKMEPKDCYNFSVYSGIEGLTQVCCRECVGIETLNKTGTLERLTLFGNRN